MQRGLIYFVLLSVTSSCGGSSESDSTRLPYADAPLDTLDTPGQAHEGSAVVAAPESIRNRPEWEELTLDGLPSPGELAYVRYTNERFGYSVAYPDTLLRPSEPVGENRGMTFVSASDDVRMMVYAMYRDNFEDLNAQFEAAVEDADAQVTYSARDDDFYVVSGQHEGEVFYEKAISGGGTITTFRMHYPAEDKAYFDAVAALIAASLEH